MRSLERRMSYSEKRIFTIRDTHIYTPDDICEVLDEYVDPDYLVKKRGKAREGRILPKYLNIPCAFDIETSSFYQDGEKRACMYVWQMGINGACIVGRTWDEFMDTIRTISAVLGLGPEKRMIIYVHNLAYEFQFMRFHLKELIESVFALDERKPVKVELSNGIEFRCSYILSGYSLLTVGKNLVTYKVEKAVGDLDYTLMRHSGTLLTEQELHYMINDILVVMAYIQERIEADGDISRIQLTKTGYVRKLCREACFKSGFSDYRQLMFNLQLTPEEYILSKRAFQGGFTHASALNVGRVYENVASYDFTSSYPTVLISEKYPMNKGRKVYPKTKEEFEKYLRAYCCIFEIEFTNIEAKYLIENPISSSRCQVIENGVFDNGRVYSADRIRTTITNVDYWIFKAFYNWDTYAYRNLYIYEKAYLPKPMVETILQLYGDKTKLKGVLGSEAEYLSSKEAVNSVYGMLVTDIVRPDITYNKDDWGIEKKEVAPALEKYNTSISRFSFYPWGVFVTAYARYNLFTGIMACIKEDARYLYADTDSLKVAEYWKIQKYIEKYNQAITAKLERALDYHGLDHDLIRPKTIKGVEKPLGVWDFEGIYTFKTLGAKRYMTEHGDDLSITVSGVNKFIAVPWLHSTYGTNEKIFKAFDDELIFPEEATGKNTHTYIDYAQDGVLVDYLGISGEYHELSSVHLEGAPYHLNITDEYINYLKGIHEKEVGY